MRTSISEKSALVALSGGVDSSVAALRLLRAGYTVSGVVMLMSDAHAAVAEAAEQSAAELGIPLITLDLREKFKKLIIDGFVAEYLSGRTPNPCVRCNPLLKFAELLRVADESGCGVIATGHYARVVSEGGRYYIATAASLPRDQSYMLYRLGQGVLSRLILPLAESGKPEVRAEAEAAGLSCNSAPDSSENCFLPDNDYAGFIRRAAGERPGEIMSPDGEVCGRHTGLYNFTVGQRKGLGSFGEPVFVKRLDAAENRVWLGRGDDIFSASARVGDCVRHIPDADYRCEVKIRSAAKPAPARAVFSDDGCEVFFDTPQRAAAPGQSAVFYRGGVVVGGGVIG